MFALANPLGGFVLPGDVGLVFFTSVGHFSFDVPSGVYAICAYGLR
jgi:hypothetical protein